MEIVYSFNAEKESSTRRTLHAGVNTYKGANGELFLSNSIPQTEEKSTVSEKKVSDNIHHSHKASADSDRVTITKGALAKLKANDEEEEKETSSEIKKLKKAKPNRSILTMTTKQAIIVMTCTPQPPIL